MFVSDLKYIAAENCTSFDPEVYMRVMDISDISRSCESCKNYKNGRCIKGNMEDFCHILENN
ncbi:hypothetical protein IAI10_20620 [Clostridium sp. 19966]|uniref:hypothetical protein n=1 Tax=Clostridium sp. 19966 TaxID=2768166 RepID=UPI0028DFF5E0|nr:hypothetical protein [Clostridium sp. 19966]MDT8719057.1 hypothetical protein [Clostridium sp. 19966]